MNKTTILALSCAIVLLGVAAILTSNPSAGIAAEKAGKAYKPGPGIDTHHLMEGVDATFSSIMDNAKKGGRKGFKAARHQAYALATLMDVLPHFESEEVTGAEKRAKWDKLSHQLRDEILAVGPVLKKKDGKGALALLEKAGKTCEACHEMRD